MGVNEGEGEGEGKEKGKGGDGKVILWIYCNKG